MDGTLFFDGDKKVIYEVPDLSSFTVDGNGYRIYVPDDIPSATKNSTMTTYDLWSRWVDFHDVNKWALLALDKSGGAYRYTDSAGDVYALIDVRLLNDWVLVPADYLHNWLVIGNLYPNEATGFDFDCDRLTAAGVSPRIQFADRGEKSVIAGGGTFTPDDRALLEDIHGQVERTVWFDELAITAGEGYQHIPFKVLNNLVDYTQANGINKVKTLSDMTLTKHFRNVILEGIGLPSFNADGFNLKGMEFRKIKFDGVSDGVDPYIIRDCEISQGAGLFGYVEKCSFNGDCSLNGSTHIVGGISNKEGAGFIWLDVNGFGLQTTSWHRSLGISNMTSGIHTVEMYGGQLHLDEGCIGGTIFLRGNYSVKPENLGTTLIIDQTEKANLLGTESFP